MFRSAWITHPSAVYSENRIYWFKKTFTLSEKPDKAPVNLSAEARYKLFINGRRAAFGPCRPSGEEKYYDTFDAAPYLKAGENELFCEVLELADNGDMTKPCAVYGVRRTGNLLFALEMDCGETVIRTDDSWDTAPSPTASFAPHTWFADAAVFEEHANGGAPAPVPDWTRAKVAAQVDSPREKPYPWGIVNPMFVIPRPIPMLYQKDVPFADSGDGFYIADELTFGFPRFAFEGKGHARVMYAESFGSGGEKKDRLDRSLSFNGIYDEIDVDGTFVYEPFWPRCARIVRIETDGDLCLTSFVFTEIGYPLTVPEGCDFGSETDNRLWKISVATLMRCMQESYEDCPYYEQLQYAMDTSLQMLFNYQLTDDDALARKAIRDFRLSQRADGLLSSRYPTVEAQYIPSFSFYYIFMVSEHYKRFGDLSLVRENLRGIDGVLEWFAGCLDGSGLLRRTMYWDFVDWATAWGKTAGEPVTGDEPCKAIVSAMYVWILRRAADLFDAAGRRSTAEEYRARADKTEAAVEALCWDEDRGLYADEIRHEYFSQHMQVWCVLSGIAGKHEGRARRIMENAMDLGTRCTFAYAYFWFRALEEVGLYEKTAEMMDRLRGLLALNCTTIPETPDAPRSDCHAWGAIAIYEFAAVVLGVRTVSAAEKKLRIAPRIDGKTHAEGTVYTGCGPVWVRWTAENGRFTLTVRSSEEAEKEIVLPDGQAVVTREGEITLTAEV